MALMMDVSSNVRERLLEVLCTCTSDELELSRRAHIYSCSVHARKMAQILSFTPSGCTSKFHRLRRERPGGRISLERAMCKCCSAASIRGKCP